MKSRFLNIQSPCSENWEQMTPEEQGRYCKACAKHVQDFTALTPLEISQQLQNTKGTLCARVTPQQLKTPLLNLEASKKLELPYANIAAGLLAVTTLTMGPTAQADTTRLKTEWVATTDSVVKTKTETPNTEVSDHDKKLELTFRGRIISNATKKPLVHAKVLFVTLQKIYSTYTEKNGSFSLNIPSHLVDEANVIRVDYDSLQGGRDGLYLFYDNEDFILSKNELQSFNRIYAEPSPMIMGMVFYERPKENPKVYVNGTSMDFNKYQKQYAEDAES